MKWDSRLGAGASMRNAAARSDHRAFRFIESQPEFLPGPGPTNGLELNDHRRRSVATVLPVIAISDPGRGLRRVYGCNKQLSIIRQQRIDGFHARLVLILDDTSPAPPFGGLGILAGIGQANQH